MARFRNNAVIVHAEQYQYNVHLPAGVVVALKDPDTGKIYRYKADYTGPGKLMAIVTAIHTSDGWQEVTDGDWIIAALNGEKSLCRPDVFDKTHEPVAD